MGDDVTDTQILAQTLADEIVARRRLEIDNRLLRIEIRRLQSGAASNITTLERIDTAGPEGN